jgi:RHS repeat-associated protein
VRNFSFDANGSTLDDGVNTYSYDTRGRMVQAVSSIGTTSYQVNALGQRVRKTNTSMDTVFHYDTRGRLIAETSPAGAVVREYLYLGDIPVAVAQGALAFIHTDHLNTPRLVADATGTTVWRWDQAEPFGNNPADEDPDGNSVAFDLPLRLPGQRYDAETALHYNYYRDYDSSLGRYAESDPIGLAGGLNTYAYVTGYPLAYSDERGLAGAMALCSVGPLGCAAGGLISVLGGALVMNAVGSDTESDSKKTVETICPNCPEKTPRSVAMALAYSWAGIPVGGGGGAVPLTWTYYHMPAGLSRKDFAWADFHQRYAAPYYGWGTPTGASVVEHPFGHPDHPGQPHHSCPHFHAVNAQGVERIFPYRPGS